MTSSAHASTVRTSDSSMPLVPLLDERWSPRSYDATATIDDDQLAALLEAARWAPSARNLQPRRFIVGRRGTATFDTIHGALLGFNGAWAGNASVLIIAIAETTGADGSEMTTAEYDLGQSIAHLSVQAHAEGLHAHQMGGVDWDAIRLAFDLPESLKPVTVTAVGTVAPATELEGRLAELEGAPRTRLSLDELVLVRD